MNRSTIRLFTTFFFTDNTRRRSEYAEALEKNLNCSAIQEIALLCEGKATPNANSPKIHSRSISQRPAYADFFTWINGLVGLDDISIIANSDIYFDSSLAAVDSFLEPGECYALSRWDVQEDGSSRLFDRNDSQDAWIFRGPVRDNVVANFPLGVPRCDNRILHELRAAGYRVTNPSFSIRSHHLHRGRTGPIDYADSPNEVPRPYDYAFPENIRSLPRIFLHNARHGDSRIRWRFDRRRWRAFPARLLRRALSRGR